MAARRALNGYWWGEAIVSVSDSSGQPCEARLMTNIIRLAAVAVALTATATSAAAQESDSYRAAGTEPFWSVTISHGRMVYESPEGRPVSVAAPVARPSFNGRRYVTRRLVVDITRQPCSDGMSDRTYQDRVLVTIDGRTLDGCGGGFTEPSRLAHTSWRIVAINNVRVPVSGPYRIDFTEDRISGQAGCNRLSGGYTLAGDALTPGRVAATRMACRGPGAVHERAALRVLGGRLRVAQPSENVMVLSGRTGSIRLEMVPAPRPRR